MDRFTRLWIRIDGTAISIKTYNYPIVKEVFEKRGDFYSLGGMVCALKELCKHTVMQEMQNENS